MLAAFKKEQKEDLDHILPISVMSQVNTSLRHDINTKRSLEVLEIRFGQIETSIGTPIEQMKLRNQLLQQLLSIPPHPSILDANKKGEISVAEQSIPSEHTTTAVTLSVHQKFQSKAFVIRGRR